MSTLELAAVPIPDEMWTAIETTRLDPEHRAVPFGADDEQILDVPPHGSTAGRAARPGEARS